MSLALLYSLSALVALLPALVLGRCLRLAGDTRPGWRFWSVVAVAWAGPALWSYLQISHGWLSGLGTALWVTVAASVGLFALASAVSRVAWRLLPLLMPYLTQVALLATVALVIEPAPALGPVGGPAGGEEPPGLWLDLHIVLSVLTYALSTLAAVAALAGVLQARALKAKQPSALTRTLPALADSERLQNRLLLWCQTVLGAGLLSGLAAQWAEYGHLWRFSHKTLFSVAAFIVIGLLLLVQARTGARGRGVARVVLVAYLLLTLAYPGLKFVRELVIAWTGA